jgi:hypothetical protein
MLKDFIWLMTYTGLRICDVAFFHMNRLMKGDVFTYIPVGLRTGLTRASRST